MAVFLAAGIVVLSAAVGLGVDTIRGYLVQSRLAAALDAAGLAGARVMYSDTRDDDIRMYFEANFPQGYMGATIDGPNFTVDANSEILSIDASATIDTSFMRILGFQTLTVSANSEITRQTELLELVLAIDMSGSMDNSVSGGGTRIAAARAAAEELVKILFGDDETKALLKIGIVPWNGKVNVTSQRHGVRPVIERHRGGRPLRQSTHRLGAKRSLHGQQLAGSLVESGAGGLAGLRLRALCGS